MGIDSSRSEGINKMYTVYKQTIPYVNHKVMPPTRRKQRNPKRGPDDDLGYKCTDVGEPQCVPMPEGGERGPFQDLQSCEAECEATFDMQKSWPVRSGNMDNYGERLNLQPAEDDCLFDRAHEVMMTFAVPDGPRSEGFFAVSVDHFLGQMAHELGLLRVVWTRKHNEDQSTKTAADLAHGGGFAPEETSDAMFLKLDFSAAKGYRMILEDETLERLRVCLQRYKDMPKDKQRGVVFSPFTLIRVRLGSGELEYKGDDPVHPQRPVAVPPDNPGTYRIGSSSGVFGLSERHAAEPSEKIYRVHVDPRFFAEFEEDVSLLYLACRGKNTAVIEWLIAMGIDIDSDETVDGVTPLYSAIVDDAIYIVKWMIKSGANVNKPNNTPGGHTPLHGAMLATYTEEMVALLIDGGADVNKIGGMDAGTPLLDSIKCKQLGVAELLVEAGADVSEVEANTGHTPLILAVALGLEEIADLLLLNGSDVNYVDSSGKTPLSIAIETNNEEMLSRLLIASADVNQTNEIDGDTPLHKAIMKGFGNIVVQLLVRQDLDTTWIAEPTAAMIKNIEDAKSSVNQTNSITGTTPLYLAAQRDERFILKTLIDYGAYVNPEPLDSLFGTTALLVAIEGYHTAVVKLLIKSGADVNRPNKIDGQTPLMVAIENMINGGIVQMLIDWGADVDQASEIDGQTPLFLAAQSESKHHIVKSLIEAEADVNTTSEKDGRTPLMIAVTKDAQSIVALLIDEGADVEQAETRFGDSPLVQAAHHEFYDMMELLIEHGADVDNGKTGTPLMIAAHVGNEKIVKLLIRGEADLNKATPVDGQTPLFTAAKEGFGNIAALLIDAGADVDRSVADGGGGSTSGTPLYVAANRGHVDIVRLLITSGARVNKPNTNHGDIPLLSVAKQGLLKIVELLVDGGSDVNRPDYHGTTPLWIAACCGNWKTVRLLIDKNANVNQYNKTVHGTTPLWIAVKHGCENSAEMLINAGADVNTSDKTRFTSPLWFAVNNGFHKIVAMLIDNGADVNTDAELTGLTPLMVAARKNEGDIIRSLIIRGADIDKTNRISGNTALHLAILNNANDSVKILLDEFKADHNKMNSVTQTTPAYVAVKVGNLPALGLLVQKGARIPIVSDSATPLLINRESDFDNAQSVPIETLEAQLRSAIAGPNPQMS